MELDILDFVSEAINESYNEENKEKELYTDHPLKEISVDERVLYLQGIALVMNADKEIHDDEVKYLSILLNSCELEASSLDELLTFAKSPDKDAIKQLFSTFKNQAIAETFIYDAMVMAKRDDELQDVETKLESILVNQLQISSDKYQHIQYLFKAISVKNWHACAMVFHLNLLDLDHYLHIFSFHKADINFHINKAKSIKVNDTEFSLVPLPQGSFNMGAYDGDENAKPVHSVNLKAFSMMECVVTFDLMDERLKDTGADYLPKESYGRGRQPLVDISWEDITKNFIPWLNKKTGREYRLPSESEWEYACRAGTISNFNTGDTISHEQAAFMSDRYTSKNVQEVNKYEPNGWGLYDMHGNVSEWVQDSYSENYEKASEEGNPLENLDTYERMIRGGGADSWRVSELSSHYRKARVQDSRHYMIGFRLVESLPCLTNEI